MKKRFVSIWFKNLDIDWLIRKRPELKAQPIAFQTISHGKLVIVSANDLAIQAGVQSGMAIADTKWVCPKLRCFDYNEAVTPALMTILADWCFRYTPIVAIDGQDGIFLDVTGCTHLLGGEKPFLASLVKKLLSLGYNNRAAMSDTLGTSWAIARYGRETPIIEQGGNRQAIGKLPIQALRLNDAALESLAALGIRTIQQLYEIPRPMLLKRYGQNVSLRLEQALGSIEEYVKPRVQSPDFTVRLDIFETVSTPEGIAEAAKNLIEQLCGFLDKEQQGLQRMQLRAYRIDGNVQFIEIATAAVTRNPSHLFRLIQDKLQKLEPGLGFELFLLTGFKTSQLSAVQNKLLQDTDAEHLQAALELVDRAAIRLGSHQVHGFAPIESHWPERAYMTRSVTTKAKTAWPADLQRPTRLLKSPAEIEVIAPIPDYPPKLFRYQGKAHRIRHADGPERIEGEWWRENKEMRDYYRLEDEQGNRYWVFRKGRYGTGEQVKWYLHGYL